MNTYVMPTHTSTRRFGHAGGGRKLESRGQRKN